MKACSYFVEEDKQYTFSEWTLPAIGPYRQILNFEWLHFRLKSELSDEIRVSCMWSNNLSEHAGDLNIFCN